jgi:hypothetical protein
MIIFCANFSAFYKFSRGKIASDALPDLKVCRSGRTFCPGKQCSVGDFQSYADGRSVNCRVKSSLKEESSAQTKQFLGNEARLLERPKFTGTLLEILRGLLL